MAYVVPVLITLALTEVFSAKLRGPTGQDVEVQVDVVSSDVVSKRLKATTGEAMNATTLPLQLHQVSISEGNEADWHPFEGVGALSAGASSRLLQDYPEEQRSEILDLLFKPQYGASLQVLKVEIGGDMQSTDGSEPSHMRYRGEKPDCSRGYEAWLMSEAKARNPDIRTYGLAWGVPGWIGNGTFFSKDNIKYHVAWLECLKENYKVEIDYMGIWNEMTIGDSWYVFELDKAIKDAGLKTELVLLDAIRGVSQNFLDIFHMDEKFQDVVAAVGLHYPCEGNQKLEDALEQHPKTRFWASEELSTVADWGGAGCWGRMINQNFVRMNATSSIAWSLIWSAYPNLECFGNGLLYAFEPWSGHYEVTAPVWTSAHTTQFTEVGWKYLPAGEAAGLLPEGGTYVTIVSPDVKDFTIVMETLAGRCFYHDGCLHTKQAELKQIIRLKLTGRLAAAANRSGTLEVWATDSQQWFQRATDVAMGEDGSLQVSVPADAIVTITTLKKATKQGNRFFAAKELANKTNSNNKTEEVLLVPEPKPVPAPISFPLPFVEAFEKGRVGKSPAFFSDQGGAFEIVEASDGVLSGNDTSRNSTKKKKVLEQQVLQAPIAWIGKTPEPFTLFGSTNWTDVAIEVMARFDSKAIGMFRQAPLLPFGHKLNALNLLEIEPPMAVSAEAPRRISVCSRVLRYEYFGTNSRPEGYCLEVHDDEQYGSPMWKLTASGALLAWGVLSKETIHKVLGGGWLQLRLEVKKARILVFVEGSKVLDLVETSLPMGQVALGCGYHKCQFDDLKVEPSTNEVPELGLISGATGKDAPILKSVDMVAFDYHSRSCHPAPQLIRKRDDFSGYVGFRFSVSIPVEVKSLGRMMIRGGQMLATAHTIQLLQLDTENSNLSMPVASVALSSVPTSQAGMRLVEDGYVYVDLSESVVLRTGKEYVLASSELQGGDIWFDQALPAEAPDSIRVLGPAYRDASGWHFTPYPGHVFGPLNAMFAPIQVDWKSLDVNVVDNNTQNATQVDSKSVDVKVVDTNITIQQATGPAAKAKIIHVDGEFEDGQKGGKMDKEEEEEAKKVGDKEENRDGDNTDDNKKDGEKEEQNDQEKGVKQHGDKDENKDREEKEENNKDGKKEEHKDNQNEKGSKRDGATEEARDGEREDTKNEDNGEKTKGDEKQREGNEQDKVNSESKDADSVKVQLAKAHEEPPVAAVTDKVRVEVKTVPGENQTSVKIITQPQKEKEAIIKAAANDMEPQEERTTNVNIVDESDSPSEVETELVKGGSTVDPFKHMKDDQTAKPKKELDVKVVDADKIVVRVAEADSAAKREVEEAADNTASVDVKEPKAEVNPEVKQVESKTEDIEDAKELNGGSAKAEVKGQPAVVKTAVRRVDDDSSGAEVKAKPGVEPEVHKVDGGSTKVIQVEPSAAADDSSAKLEAIAEEPDTDKTDNARVKARPDSSRDGSVDVEVKSVKKLSSDVDVTKMETSEERKEENKEQIEEKHREKTEMKEEKEEKREREEKEDGEKAKTNLEEKTQKLLLEGSKQSRAKGLNRHWDELKQFAGNKYAKEIETLILEDEEENTKHRKAQVEDSTDDMNIQYGWKLISRGTPGTTAIPAKKVALELEPKKDNEVSKLHEELTAAKRAEEDLRARLTAVEGALQRSAVASPVALAKESSDDSVKVQVQEDKTLGEELKDVHY